LCGKALTTRAGKEDRGKVSAMPRRYAHGLSLFGIWFWDQGFMIQRNPAMDLAIVWKPLRAMHVTFQNHRTWACGLPSPPSEQWDGIDSTHLDALLSILV
jgi:hypothetical protein